jgi:hypothetical protein
MANIGFLNRYASACHADDPGLLDRNRFQAMALHPLSRATASSHSRMRSPDGVISLQEVRWEKN